MDYEDVSEWRVLAIDDIKDNLIVLEDIFMFNDAQIVTASSGKEGLKLAESFKPNLILLDLMMPGMDGWEVIRELRKNPKTEAIPVIAVTGDVNITEEKASEAGFSGYILKPYTEQSLLDSIKAILAK